MAKLLKNYINEFDKNKIVLIKYWITNKEVVELLKKYDIEIKFFIKEYAIGVLEYYIDVVREKKEIGDCPTIENLINYLKLKKLSSAELFILCSGFKNSLIEFTYDLKITNYQIEKELNYIFEQNFAGVLKKYTESVENFEEELLKSSDIVDKHVIMSRTNSSGKIVSVSEAFCEISGYSKEELIGKNHNVIRHPDMPKEIFEDLWNTISNGKTWQGEIKNRTKTGGFYWVNVTITPIFDENEKIVFFDAIRQDITSKKELEENQNILVEQSKSAAMGEMISMIAHQWRQPLQAISILIQKLPMTKTLDGVITDELLEQVVFDVGRQLEYMSKTIDDFRDFFLPDKPKEEVFIEEVINKALDFVSFMLKTDSIEISLDIKTETKVLVHVNELVQVLINLFKNSKDIMEEKEIENREINILVYDKYKYVVIEVEDNGGGIPKDLMNKIFEPYFSTKDDKNGTGLGLYMCKTIIEKHTKGFLSVKNSNKGAKFQIKLPIS